MVVPLRRIPGAATIMGVQLPLRGGLPGPAKKSKPGLSVLSPYRMQRLPLAQPKAHGVAAGLRVSLRS
jgi:hypothetical protein